jgi:hypothetical protein
MQKKILEAGKEKKGKKSAAKGKKAKRGAGKKRG